MPLVLSTICAILALFFYEKKPLILNIINQTKVGRSIYRFFNQRYWFELIYNKFVVSTLFYIGHITNTYLDKGVIELIGPRGAVAGLYKISNYFASFDSGSIARYGFVMLSGLCWLLIIWLTYSNYVYFKIMDLFF